MFLLSNLLLLPLSCALVFHVFVCVFSVWFLWPSCFPALVFQCFLFPPLKHSFVLPLLQGKDSE